MEIFCNISSHQYYDIIWHLIIGDIRTAIRHWNRRARLRKSHQWFFRGIQFSPSELSEACLSKFLESDYSVAISTGDNKNWLPIWRRYWSRLSFLFSEVVKCSSLLNLQHLHQLAEINSQSSVYLSRTDVSQFVTAISSSKSQGSFTVEMLFKPNVTGNPQYSEIFSLTRLSTDETCFSVSLTAKYDYWDNQII